jgi:hypothetical protein
VTKIRSPDFGIDRHENPADSAGKGIRGRRIRKFIPTTVNMEVLLAIRGKDFVLTYSSFL